tara:strand:- start:2 stop:175 length:174 start_codon:yes stop_codon:yes gene_type:complete
MNKKGYKIKFPNEYYHERIPNIDGFKMEEEIGDEVFGWFDGIYISVIKEDYERYINE